VQISATNGTVWWHQVIKTWERKSMLFYLPLLKVRRNLLTLPYRFHSYWRQFLVNFQPQILYFWKKISTREKGKQLPTPMPPCHCTYGRSQLLASRPCLCEHIAARPHGEYITTWLDTVEHLTAPWHCCTITDNMHGRYSAYT